MFWFMLLMNLLIPLTMVFVGIYFKKAALPEINPLFDDLENGFANAYLNEVSVKIVNDFSNATNI